MDLSHWDFAEHFSGYDAAALILGIEPRESEEDQHRVQVVEERIELDYARACNAAQHGVIPGLGPGLTIPDDDLLLSVKLDELWRKALAGNDEPLDDWLCKPRLHQFRDQVFHRAAIAKWLVVFGMDSKYAFDRTPGRKQATSGSELIVKRWPWGDHHTEALGHLEAAARRFWGENYDPTDLGTAATNSQVAEWLKTERGVSGNMADSIASILRADNLRTGPR